MELDGSIKRNLVSAIRSAKKLRHRPVHADTIDHWNDLLTKARQGLQPDSSPEQQALGQLVSELQAELADR